MKSTLSTLVLSAMLLVGIGMAPAALGQQSVVTVMLDGESYYEGDTIIVTGTGSPYGSPPLTIDDPNGDRLRVHFVSIDADGKFSTTVLTGGLLWKESGIYTLTIGDEASATFMYFATAMPVPSDPVDDMMDGTTDDAMDDMMEMTDDASGTGMLSDGIMVLIKSDEPTAGMAAEITVVFKDAEHVNYDVLVRQGDADVLDAQGTHGHGGIGTHMTAPLESADPLDITITFQGYGIDEITGDFPQDVAFANIVPEFGTTAIMILAVAVISVTMISAKSRIVPRL